MFCGKCGSNNPENAKICSKCGAQLGNASYSVPNAQAAAKKSAKTNKMVGIGIVVVVAVILLIIIFSLFGRGYKSTVKKYINASYSGNGKTIVSLIPKKAVKDYLKEEDYEKSDLIDDISYELNKQLNRLGDNWSYTYKIVDVDDMDSDDLEDLKDDYRDYYGIKIKGAKEVEVEMTIRVKSSNYEGTDTVYVPVVKIGSSWYLDIENMSLF